MNLKNKFKSVSYFLLYSTICLLLLALDGCSEPSYPLKIPPNLVCYAATYMKGIYTSENGGESWYPLGFDHKKIHTYFKRLFRGPLDPNVLYITTSGGGLFELNLRNGKLEEIQAFRNQYATSLAFIPPEPNPGTPRILIATSGKGIFEGHNPRNSFQQLNAGLTYREVNTIAAHKNDIYAGTLRGIFSWDKQAGRWTDFSNGIKNKNILSICVPPSMDVIYAGSGVFDGRRGWFEDVPSLYRSKTGKWEPVDAGLPDGTIVYNIVANEKRPERIYLGTSDGVYRSTDRGKVWSKVNKGLAKALKVFKIEILNGENGNDVICIASSRGIFMTNDTAKIVWFGKNYGLPQTAITDLLLVN